MKYILEISNISINSDSLDGLLSQICQEKSLAAEFYEELQTYKDTYNDSDEYE